MQWIRIATVFMLASAMFVGGTFGQTTQPADQVAEQLLHGDSAARLAAMKQIDFKAPTKADDSVLAALAACADDPSEQVRAQVAVVVGVKWLQSIGDAAPAKRAIDIELKLAADPSLKVRHDVVTAGLRRVKQKDDRVIAGLVSSVMTMPVYEGNVQAHVIGGLADVPPEKIAPLLEPYWANCQADPEKASWAYLIYCGATRNRPPGVERLDHAGHFLVLAVASPSFNRDELAKELQSRLPADTVARNIFVEDRGQLVIWLVIDGVANRRRTVDALGQSHLIHVQDDPGKFTQNIATPEAVQRIEAGVRSAATQTAPATQHNFAAAFDDLYKHLGDVYPNFQMKQIDWKNVGDELLPQAEQVKSEREFGLLVEQLVARLQDTHAVILKGTASPPDPDLPQWDPGFTCLMDDRNRPVVYAVESGSPAQQAGIKPGLTIISVNGVPAQQLIAQTEQAFSKYFGYSSDRILEYDAARAFFKQADRGAACRMEVEDIHGKQSGFSLPANVGDRYLPRLPVPREGIDDSANVSWTKLDDRVGYIYVRRIQNGLEDALDQAVNDLHDVKGLIIDVRGNSGGGFDPDTALVNFDPAPTTASTSSQRPRFTGPIAMLIDGRCVSAGEGWTSWFVANKRARLFGTGTAGASSRKETYTLTNGMYQVVVPVKAYTGSLDRPIERRGLEPDVNVRCTAADLAAGKDTVVEAARAWLESDAVK